jgi:UrcA family protein
MELYMKQILITKTLAALIGLASFASFTQAASAGAHVMPETITDERAITVRFGDLNPGLPADASELLARVRVAARDACLRNDESRQIFLNDDREACMAAAYANAITAINAKRKVNLEAVAARHDEDQNLNAAR